MKKFLLKVFFFIVSFGISLFIIFTTFKNIFEAKYLLFPYALHPFDIVSLYPDTWILLKKLYIISFSISYIILYNKFSNLIYSKFSTNKQKTNPISLLETSSLSLFVGISNNIPIFISEKGLYQNILITGTIGTGKTSSAMYPFTKQLLKYNASNAYFRC